MSSWHFVSCFGSFSTSIVGNVVVAAGWVKAELGSILISLLWMPCWYKHVGLAPARLLNRWPTHLICQRQRLGSFQKFVAVSLYSWLVLCRVDGLTVNVGRSFSQKCDCAVETWQCRNRTVGCVPKKFGFGLMQQIWGGCTQHFMSFYVMFMGTWFHQISCAKHGTWELRVPYFHTKPKIAAASPLLQSLAGVWMAQAFPSTPPATSWVATDLQILQCMVGAPKLPPCFGRPPSYRGKTMGTKKRHGSER